MAKYDFKKMSIQEIMNYYSIIIGSEHLKQIVKDIGVLEEYKMHNEINSYSAVSKYLNEQSDNIDKEKFMFILLKNTKIYTEAEKVNITTQSNISKSALLEYKMIERTYEKCKEELKDSNVEVPIIEFKDNRYTIEKFETVNDLIGKPNKKIDELRKRNYDRFRSITEKIPPDVLFLQLDLNDWEEFICYYKKMVQFSNNL